MTQVRIALLALVAITAAAPSAHAGAKQAWDVEAVEGSYSAAMKATPGLNCETIKTFPADGSFYDQINQASYAARFHGRKLTGAGPYLKYFPALGGPASPGPVGLPLTVESTSDETIDGLHLSEDEEGRSTCRMDPPRQCTDTAEVKLRPRYMPMGALTRGKRVRVGLPVIGLTSVLPTCEGGSSLHPGFGDDGGEISPQIQTWMPLGSFKRRNIVVRFEGSRRVRHKGGLLASGSGTLRWSATVKLRKVVIPEDCRERAGGSPFVCRL